MTKPRGIKAWNKILLLLGIKSPKLLMSSWPVSAGMRGFLLEEWGVLPVLIAGTLFHCGYCSSCRKYSVQWWIVSHGFKWLKVSKNYFYWWTIPNTFRRKAKHQPLKQLFQKKKNDVPRIWDLVCHQTPWSKMQCPSEEVAGYVLVW